MESPETRRGDRGQTDGPPLGAGEPVEARVLATLKEHVHRERKHRWSGPTADGGYIVLDVSPFVIGILVAFLVMSLWRLPAGEGSVAIILALMAAEFTILAVVLHRLHLKETERFGVELATEAADLNQKKSGAEDKSSDAEQWITFLQGRLDSKSSWLQSLVAVGGLIPVATLIQSVPPLQVHFSLPTAALVGAIAGIIAGWAFFAIRSTLRERDDLILLMTLVLGGLLREDKDIALAYFSVAFAAAPR